MGKKNRDIRLFFSHLNGKSFFVDQLQREFEDIILLNIDSMYDDLDAADYLEIFIKLGHITSDENVPGSLVFRI